MGGQGRRTYHRDVLEAEVSLVAEVVRGLRFPDDDDVLDPDAVLPVLVVPRFCVAQSSGNVSHPPANPFCSGERGSLPLETVIPGLSGVLLYAEACQ